MGPRNESGNVQKLVGQGTNFRAEGSLLMSKGPRGESAVTKSDDVFPRFPVFTLDEINTAHKNVKSGADFPQFAHDIRQLGVRKYDAYVTDGHAEYFGADGFTLIGPAHHPVYPIAETSDAGTFRERLKAHQRGETDYFGFSQDAANAGVEKWTVDTTAMTCTYYDKAGKMMLEEEIPELQ